MLRDGVRCCTLRAQRRSGIPTQRPRSGGASRISGGATPEPPSPAPVLSLSTRSFSLWLFAVAFRCGFSVWLFGVAFRCGFSVWLFAVASRCGFSLPLFAPAFRSRFSQSLFSRLYLSALLSSSQLSSALLSSSQLFSALLSSSQLFSALLGSSRLFAPAIRSGFPLLKSDPALGPLNARRHDANASRTGTSPHLLPPELRRIMTRAR